MLSRLRRSKGSDAGATSADAESPTIKITDVENGFLTLDHDALRSLFLRSELKDRPIAIIAIAGCLRTWKSFLLNYLLRYLRYQGWKDKKWITKNPEENIKWRTGQDPETQGIDVWNEIFTVKNSEGNEMKVLLMDTQGLFDNNTKPENNVKLLMFAALASSVLILNIMKQVQERDLENLHQCVQYAMTASKSGERYFKMQNLMVLVRDWPYPRENDFGLEGGTGYISKVLKQRESEGSSSLNEVRTFLQDSFSEVGCYLMSNPLARMDKMEKFGGKHKELDPKFRKLLMDFCDRLLHPDNIVAKQNNGTIMTARDILNILTACDTALGPDGKIQITSLMEATAKAHYSAASENAHTQYLESMKKRIPEETTLEDSEIDKWHSDTMSIALEKYDAVADMGRKDTRELHRNDLENKCNTWIQDFKEQNRIKKEKQVLIKARFVEKSFKDYKESMDLFTVHAVKEPDLRGKHSQCSRIAVKAFTGDCERAILQSNSTDELEKQIKEYFDKKLKDNKDKLEELARIAEEERDMVNVRNEFLDEYERTMNDFMHREIPEDSKLKEKHESLSARLMENFREKFSSDRRHKFDDGLKNGMESKYRSIVSQNKDKRNTATRELRLRADDLAGKLRRETREKMADTYITSSVLEEHLEQMEARLIMEMKKMQYPKYLIEQNVSDLRRKLQNEIDQMKEENERNKPVRSNIRREVVVEDRSNDGLFTYVGRAVDSAVGWVASLFS